MRRLAQGILLFLCAVFAACVRQGEKPYISGGKVSQRAVDSLVCLQERHYTWGSNFKVVADSLRLESFPVKGRGAVVYRGERVVVAEFMVQPADSVDSIWVKVAHSQEVQGWLRESELLPRIVPDDPVSRFIHFFSGVRVLAFMALLSVFAVFSLFLYSRRRGGFLLCPVAADGFYPLLWLSFLSLAAVSYGTLRRFFPEVWLHFYFNPVLNPFAHPFVLCAFLSCVWASLVALLAAVDDLFRHSSSHEFFVCMLGWFALGMACGLFFAFATYYYVGYALCALWLACLVKRYRSCQGGRAYRCGHCGAWLQSKGACPCCGALNE